MTSAASSGPHGPCEEAGCPHGQWRVYGNGCTAWPRGACCAWDPRSPGPQGPPPEGPQAASQPHIDLVLKDRSRSKAEMGWSEVNCACHGNFTNVILFSFSPVLKFRPLGSRMYNIPACGRTAAFSSGVSPPTAPKPLTAGATEVGGGSSWGWARVRASAGGEGDCRVRNVKALCWGGSCTLSK